MENKDQAYIAAAHFDLQEKISDVMPFQGGHIHETYLIKTNNDTGPSYLLQKKNKYVFKNVPAMMQNIDKVTKHLKEKIMLSGGDPGRETISLLRTKDDKLFFWDDLDEYWAICLFINDGITYEKVTSEQLAYSGGKSIGKFQSMLSDFNMPLTDILPGYHKMKFRFDQWDISLENNVAGRKKQVEKEISWIESRRKIMLEFWDLIEKEIIPVRVAHNDTKISNILFDKNQNAFCVIDLDTVQRSTILNDFGDSIRTYTNTGREDEKETGKVAMNLDIYRAYTEGYLSEAKSFLTQTEKENLAFSTLYITFEQILRFLMDYIDGDKYYRIHYPEHNLVRARAQYKLLLSMENQLDEMAKVIRSII